MELPFRIPDALLPILFGACLWFGCVYFFLMPELTERAINLHVREECEGNADPGFCDCLFDRFWERKTSIKSTLFLSTLSLSEPRIRLFDSERNPYVEYVSLQISDPEQRASCDLSGREAVRLVEKRAADKAEEKYKKELADMEKKHNEILRQEKLKTMEHEKKIDVANTVKNSKAGQYLQEQADRAIRANELRDRTTDVSLDVWETTLNWIEKKRRQYEQRDRYE